MSEAKLQRRGVDVVFGDCYVDEKVKVKDGFLNKLIPYPSFELSFVDSRFNRSDGWFLDRDNITTHYALIGVFTGSNDEKNIVFNGIEHLNVLFVPKRGLKDYIEKCHLNLRKDVSDIVSGLYGDSMEYNGTGMHLKMTTYFSEAPVNLVVRRDVLYGIKGAREFDVFKDHIQDTLKTVAFES